MLNVKALRELFDKQYRERHKSNVQQDVERGTACLYLSHYNTLTGCFNTSNIDHNIFKLKPFLILHFSDLWTAIIYSVQIQVHQLMLNSTFHNMTYDNLFYTHVKKLLILVLNSSSQIQFIRQLK